MTWLRGAPKIGNLFSDDLEDLLGKQRKKNEEINQYYKDIAASTQKIFEEILIDIANDLYIKNENQNLCISGGSGMNSVANGVLHKRTKYKNIYIPSAPGDAGGSVGSAAFLITQLNLKKKKFNDNPYLGPSFSEIEIEEILKNNEGRIKAEDIKINKYKNFSDLSYNLSKELSRGKIIGFFNGRMEWGPRALGSRSILADPRNENIREILNLKIKRRENFRPFAPSIIDEYVKDWFDSENEVPFMSKVFQVKKIKRNIIPAVTHVDGSGRLQTVSREYNPNFYKLISDFYKMTEVPILLNTSFNENEPIVCNPTEAIECFLRTKMDILALENFLIYR